MMSEKEKLALLEETLDLDEGTLSDIEEYDSMAKLSLIVMMDDECGVKLTGDIVKKFQTVADILDCMK